jgi:hypothetical protein
MLLSTANRSTSLRYRPSCVTATYWSYPANMTSTCFSADQVSSRELVRRTETNKSRSRITLMGFGCPCISIVAPNSADRNCSRARAWEALMQHRTPSKDTEEHVRTSMEAARAFCLGQAARQVPTDEQPPSPLHNSPCIWHLHAAAEAREPWRAPSR